MISSESRRVEVTGVATPFENVKKIKKKEKREENKEEKESVN